MPVHYLRANERVWTPAHTVFFDTETVAEPTETGEVLRPCLWMATAVQRRTRAKNPRPQAWAEGSDGAGFCDWLDATARRERSTWAFAHNLAFDATAMDVPVQMRRRGWRLTDFSTSDGSPFFRLSLADHSLLLADSWSWLPVALQGIAKAVGKVKPPLPDDPGRRGELRARCRADVDILATAVLDLMAWWDRENLGNWSLTGAGCGWNAYRHMTTGPRVLIDPDPAARAFERSALYGGRREAFVIGPQPTGRYLEMDLRNAYPTAAARYPLPVKRVRAFDTLEADHAFLRAPNYGVIARALVRLDQPAVPMRWARQVFHPVGRFWTTLASPELEPLIAAGKVEAIGPGYAYRTGMPMADWARWVIALANGEIDGAPEVARLAGKHWSRAVIGKWASRSTELTEWGPAPNPGWHLEEAWHAGAGAPASVVDIAGTRYAAVRNLESDNAFPAVTVWVESLVRRALTAAMDTMAAGLVLTCDTDGMIVADNARAALEQTLEPAYRSRSKLWAGAADHLTAATTAAEPFTLVEKAAHAEIDVAGPVHWRTPTVRRLSGVRGDAVETEPGTFTFMTWPKLAWQLQHGRPDGYVRARRTVRLGGPYTHRWVLEDGSTAAPVAYVDDAGASQLAGFSATSAAAAGFRLAPGQHQLLSPLADL